MACSRNRHALSAHVTRHWPFSDSFSESKELQEAKKKCCNRLEDPGAVPLKFLRKIIILAKNLEKVFKWQWP
jgi:hypothetical protein